MTALTRGVRPVSACDVHGIGAAEIAGTVGVVAGIVSDDLAPRGLAAAVGLVLVGLGAGVNYLKAGDEPKTAVLPIVLAVLAVVYIVATAAA